MSTEEKKVWGIHTMDDNLFLKKSIIAIGWEDFGDLTKVEPTRDAFKAHYADAYPDAKKGQIPTSAGMLYRFIHEAQVGDFIVFPSKIDRRINIGTIEGDYYYDNTDGTYPQRREVKWLKHMPRTMFSQGALHEIGSALTFFMVKNYADEFLAALDKGFVKIVTEDESEDETVGATAEDIKESTKDLY